MVRASTRRISGGREEDLFERNASFHTNDEIMKGHAVITPVVVRRICLTEKRELPHQYEIMKMDSIQVSDMSHRLNVPG